MDIGRSFTFMFDDEDWLKKLAIGGLLVLLSAIPLLNIFTALVVAGYALRVMQNVSKGVDTPLPEWDDWGGDWMKGLMVTLAFLIFALPNIVIGGASGIASSFLQNGMSSDAEAFAGICIAGLSCLSALWGLLLVVYMPSATLKYAELEEFSAFFKFGENLAFVRDNLGNYIVAILLTIVAAILSGFGVILCVIGVFFTAFWSSLVQPHLFGQVKALAGGIAPVEGVAEPATPVMPSYGDLSTADLSGFDVDEPAEDEGEAKEQ